jgi:S-adenosylmethionine/arginine decarboxylase-like enzyme
MLGEGVMLLLDGQTATPLSCAKIRRFLRHAPRLIRMHPITEPTVVPTPGGWTGFVIVAESHVALETQGCSVWADLFSCGPFDTARVGKVVVRLLGLQHHHGQVIYRSMRTPGAVETGPGEEKDGLGVQPLGGPSTASVRLCTP